MAAECGEACTRGASSTARRPTATIALDAHLSAQCGSLCGSLKNHRAVSEPVLRPVDRRVDDSIPEEYLESFHGTRRPLDKAKRVGTERRYADSDQYAATRTTPNPASVEAPAASPS